MEADNLLVVFRRVGFVFAVLIGKGSAIDLSEENWNKCILKSLLVCGRNKQKTA